MAMDASMADVLQPYTYSFLRDSQAWLGFPYLAELSQRAEYRQITETLSKDMTRKWIEIKASGDNDKSDRIKVIEDKFREHKVQDKFRRMAELDGFFGRGHLFVELEDVADIKVPLILDPRLVARGSLKSLSVVEPFWTYPGMYNSSEPLRADFYVPRTWYVMAKEVHRTRLLTFVSRNVADILKPAYAFGGLSMSQLAKPYVDNWLRTRQSVSDLLHSFSTTVLATNMGATLQGEASDQMALRAELYNLFRDNSGMFMIDKNTEDFRNVSAPLGGLDHLQAQAQEHMASVSHLPLVVLTGITPSGLNATSDGEIRVYETWIHSSQEHLFRDHLQTVLELVQLDEFGEVDPEITFDFNPLREMSDIERAQIKNTEAQVDATYVNLGAISPREVRVRISEDADLPYTNIDLSDPVPAEEMQAMQEQQMMMGQGEEEAGPDEGEVPFGSDFDPSEPRDEGGKWTAGGGSGGSASLFGTTKMVGGKRVQADGSPLPPHVEKLRIPPAWTDVKFSHDASAALLASGRDAKGRVQSVYNEKFVAEQAAAKFARIEELRRKFGSIKSQNDVARRTGDAKTKDSADCLALVMSMGVRPGSDTDTKAEKKAYGATTLEGQHVVEEGGQTFLRFTGKKGVDLNLPVSDPEIATMLRDRARRAGPGGKLFPATNDKALLDHTHSMDGGGFKTKDFRTHLATDTAYSLVEKIPAPKNEKEYKKAVMAVAKEVSSKLGNTPTIALQSYINPAVFAQWRQT